MGKVYTPEVIGSGFQTTNSLNTNFTNIETALEDCLSRSGATPNAMSAALDMGTNDILNAGTVNCTSLLIDGSQVPSLADIQAEFAAGQVTIDASVTAAQLAETNAETAQSAAETAQAAAEAAAASTNLPTISIADADKTLSVNAAGDGYETAVYDTRWVEVIDHTVGSYTMSDVPTEYQGPGIYGFGSNTLGPVGYVNVFDINTSSAAGVLSDSPGTADMAFYVNKYDGGTQTFSFEGESYDAGVKNAGKTFSILNLTLYKLVLVKR